MNTEIKQAHLVIMQEIVAFIQERGWYVQGLEISRLERGQHVGEPTTEEWQEKQYNWFLRIQTGPREENEMPEEAKVGLGKLS